jgi:hypothetical protein
MRELPIILVNWKCITYTEQCLASTRDDVHDHNFKAIVINNHSPDPTCAMGPRAGDLSARVVLRVVCANIGRINFALP